MLHRLRALLFGLMFASASQSAFADEVPQSVWDAAGDISRTCSSSTSVTSRAVLSVFAIAGGGTLYVVDGAKTPCEYGASLCGTGGCPLKVYRKSGGGMKLIFDQNVFSWQVVADGSRLDATVHSTHCGGRSKAPYCDVAVNVKNGKKKITKGR